MSLHHSPKIVTNGLVFCVDPANPKSYSSGSTCKDLTLNNGIGTLTDITFSNDKGFVFSNELSSQIQFTRNFVNITNSTTYIVIVDAFPPDTSPYGYGSFLSSSTIYSGGIFLGYYYAGSSNYTFQFYAADDLNNYAVVITYEIPINSWARKYMIAATLNSSIGKLYINGKLVATQANPSYNINNQNYITLGYDNIGNNVVVAKTKIYQSMIYNRSLNDNEILENYNTLKGKYKI